MVGVEATAWGRRRLLVAVAGAAVMVLLLLVGLGYTGWRVLTRQPAGENTPAGTPVEGATTEVAAGLSGPARRDAIAAAPMLRVGSRDSRRGVPATTPAPTITVPDPTSIGAEGVPGGYPRTPAGAVGQLGAIATTVLTRMSIADARAVHAAWTQAPAAPVADWPLTQAVATFLGSDAARFPSVQITAIPAAAQIKGSDGPDWVLACVLMDVRATAATTGRIAWGHCERMTWATDRWVIAPGRAPAPAPSTWPGTDLAHAAGWKSWISDTEGH